MMLLSTLPPMETSMLAKTAVRLMYLLAIASCHVPLVYICCPWVHDNLQPSFPYKQKERIFAETGSP